MSALLTRRSALRLAVSSAGHGAARRLPGRRASRAHRRAGAVPTPVPAKPATNIQVVTPAAEAPTPAAAAKPARRSQSQAARSASPRPPTWPRSTRTW